MNRASRLLLVVSLTAVVLVLGASAALAILLLVRGEEADPGWMAFISEDDGVSDIFLIRPDGSDVRQLTKDGKPKSGLDWSPDGRLIAFSAGAGQEEIWVVSANGTGLKRLTSGPGDSRQPTWSPDGSSIAFSSNRMGGSDIYVMRSDGSSVRRLTANQGQAYCPDWSPDGKSVVFLSWLDTGSTLMVLDADGTNLRRLPQRGTYCPAWSPDGSRIAFPFDRIRSRDIAVSNAEGRIIAYITDDDIEDEDASWSPDGKRIVFSSLRDNGSGEADYEVYIINDDGTGLTRLTNRDGSNYAPKWSPD